MTRTEIIRAILASDAAQEIAREVEELHGFGLEMTKITERIVSQFADALGDPHQGPVVIIALAAAQLQSDSLMPVIRDAAVSLIDAGEAAAAFASPSAVLQQDRRHLLCQFADALREAPLIESEPR